MHAPTRAHQNMAWRRGCHISRDTAPRRPCPGRGSQGCGLGSPGKESGPLVPMAQCLGKMPGPWLPFLAPQQTLCMSLCSCLYVNYISYVQPPCNPAQVQKTREAYTPPMYCSIPRCPSRTVYQERTVEDDSLPNHHLVSTATIQRHPSPVVSPDQELLVQWLGPKVSQS